MGHGRFLVFYLLCGTAAALAQTLMSPDSRVPMVGASGAIAGVMGAYFVLYPHSRIVTLMPLFFFIQVIEVPAIFFLGIWFLMQFLSGVGSIATAAAVEPAAAWRSGPTWRASRLASSACSCSGGPSASASSGGTTSRVAASLREFDFAPPCALDRVFSSRSCARSNDGAISSAASVSRFRLGRLSGQQVGLARGRRARPLGPAACRQRRAERAQRRPARPCAAAPAVRAPSAACVSNGSTSTTPLIAPPCARRRPAARAAGQLARGLHVGRDRPSAPPRAPGSRASCPSAPARSSRSACSGCRLPVARGSSCAARLERRDRAGRIACLLQRSAERICTREALRVGFAPASSARRASASP